MLTAQLEATWLSLKGKQPCSTKQGKYAPRHAYWARCGCHVCWTCLRCLAGVAPGRYGSNECTQLYPAAADQITPSTCTVQLHPAWPSHRHGVFNTSYDAKCVLAIRHMHPACTSGLVDAIATAVRGNPRLSEPTAWPPWYCMFLVLRGLDVLELAA